MCHRTGSGLFFERAKKWNDDKGVDLWIMRTDGSGSRLLVRDGAAPFVALTQTDFVDFVDLINWRMNT